MFAGEVGALVETPAVGGAVWGAPCACRTHRFRRVRASPSELIPCRSAYLMSSGFVLHAMSAIDMSAGAAWGAGATGAVGGADALCAAVGEAGAPLGVGTAGEASALAGVETAGEAGAFGAETTGEAGAFSDAVVPAPTSMTSDERSGTDFERVTIAVCGSAPPGGLAEFYGWGVGEILAQ